jgi:type IV pilus assembly protein PilO
MDFKTLDPKDPGLWPLAPRRHFVQPFCSPDGRRLGIRRLRLERSAGGARGQEKQEAKHKEDWLGKKKQAVNLDEYRRQLAEIDRSFGALLKQLPNKAEMGDMLVDINKAAQARGSLSSSSSRAVRRRGSSMPRCRSR